MQRENLTMAAKGLATVGQEYQAHAQHSVRSPSSLPVLSVENDAKQLRHAAQSRKNKLRQTVPLVELR